MKADADSFIVLAPFLPRWFIDLATDLIEKAHDVWDEVVEEAEEMTS